MSNDGVALSVQRTSRFFHGITLFCLVAVLSGLIGVTETQAGLIVPLLDHGDGAKGSNYGIRIDNGAVQTFSLQLGGASVSMKFFTGGALKNQAQIFGTVKHNQSGQLWNINAALDVHLFTNDGSEWRSNLSGDLYDGMITDLITTGDSEFGSGGMSLKNNVFIADRIGFRVVTLDMSLQSGQGAAAFTLPGQTGGNVTLYDYPQGSENIPFVLAKGHRLSASSNEIAGFGWLDARTPDAQSGNDGLTQDFLFRLGSGTPTDNNPIIPEPSSIVLLVSGGMSFLVFGRRRKPCRSGTL